MSKIRDEHSIDDISKDMFTEELFGSRRFLLELVFDAIYRTSNLETLPKRINSRIKWFVNHALDIPLSILIYTGAVFVPTIFHINDKDVVRVEGILGQSLRELGAKTVNVLLKPTTILKYIEKNIGKNIEIESNIILIKEFLRFALMRFRIPHNIISMEITRIVDRIGEHHSQPSSSSMTHIFTISPPLLRNHYRFLKEILGREPGGSYIPIPVKSRIIVENIGNILDELELRVKRTRMRASKNEFHARYIRYLKQVVEVLARTRSLLEDNESKITFMKISLQDYDSLARFILQAREKGIDRATVRAIILDKLYLKTIIPAITVASDLVELVINLFSDRLEEDDFSKLQNKLYKYKTKFNQAVNNVKDAVKDNILELDMGSIELVDRRSQQTYQYLSDKIRVFREASLTYL